MEKVEVKIIREEGVILPKYMTPGAAGMDVYAYIDKPYALKVAVNHKFDDVITVIDNSKTSILDPVLYKMLKDLRKKALVEIQQRESIQLELHESREMLASINRNISEGIFRMSPGLGITYANNSLVSILGYSNAILR